MSLGHDHEKMTNQILYDYIKRQRRRGFPIDKIREHLIKYNFSHGDISECISTLTKEERAFKINALLFLIVALAILVFAYAVLGPEKNDDADFSVSTDELISRSEQKERIKGMLYVERLEVGRIGDDGEFIRQEAVFAPQEKIYFKYRVEDIQSVPIDGVYKTAYFANILVLRPDGMIDQGYSGTDGYIFEYEYDNPGRKDSEGYFILDFDKGSLKGEYRIIANIVDVYGSEETAAQARITLR